MIELEGYKPYCLVCKLPDSRPAPCAFREFITEHEFPCGGATRFLQLELAKKALASVADNYQTLAHSRLIREGYSLQAIEKFQNSELLTNWIKLQGESEAIERFGGTFSPSISASLHGHIRIEDRFLGILYVRVQLADSNKATALPIVFDTLHEEYDNWTRFLYDEFNQFNLVIGSFESWNREWFEWWQSNNIGQERWSKLNQDDQLIANLIDFVKNLILKKYHIWQQSQK